MSRIASADLPQLVYAHGAEHDPALTDPAHFRPIADGFIKPSHGGLWTSPVTGAASDGAPFDTAWLEWCRDNEYGAEYYTHLTLISPLPDARVLLIDSVADLRAVVADHPARVGRRASAILARQYPSWASIRDAGWDAIYLTDAGMMATRYTVDPDPNLYGWDCATVLWLRPAYTVGATTVVAKAVTA